MSNRQERPISEVARIISGGTPKTSHKDYWGGDIPWLSVVDFNNDNRLVFDTEKKITEKGLDESSTTLLKKGQIIISARGTVGALAQLAKDMAFNQSCYGLDGKDDLVVNDFLFYAIKNISKKIDSYTHGAVFDTITRDTFNLIRIPIPPLHEQKAIAAVLGALDDKIELNRRMNATLEAMARALFKSWFVDFDPVRAKMAGKQPFGMDAATAALFPSRLVPSPLGDIPEGWEIKKFGDVAEPRKGKSITKKTIEEGFVPVVAGGLNPAYFHSASNAEAPVITVSASGANAGFVRLYHQNIWASDCSYINNTQTKFVYTAYVFLKERQLEIYGMQQGAAQPHIYPSDLMRLEFISPPKQVWKEMERAIVCYFEKIAANTTENMSLEKQRNYLLPRLISGDIRIPDVEKFLEAA